MSIIIIYATGRVGCLVDCRGSQWKIEKLSPHTDEIFHLRNFNNLLWQRHPEK